MRRSDRLPAIAEAATRRHRDPKPPAYRVLYTFTGGNDGANPNETGWVGLIRGEEGDLYGTTSVGGASGDGVVFKLDADGKETVLYAFSGRDGAAPSPGVIRDEEGNLHGTTLAGGAFGFGAVFKLDLSGEETVHTRSKLHLGRATELMIGPTKLVVGGGHSPTFTQAFR